MLLALVFIAATARGGAWVARAAETLDKNYDYGVFVDRKRLQVTATPITLRAGHAFYIQGWVLDYRTMRPGKSLLVARDGGTASPVQSYPLPRHDVALAIKDNGAELCGFRINLPDGLGVGSHRFHFSVVGKDGVTTDLGTDVALSIVNR